MSPMDVIWDEELLQSSNTHVGLLQQVSQSGEYLVAKEKKPSVELKINGNLSHVDGPSFILDLGMDVVQEEFDEVHLEDVIWDQESMTSPESHGLLLQLANGDELHMQQEAWFDECLAVDKRAIIDLAISDLIPHDSDMDTADRLLNDMSLDVRWDEELFHDLDSHDGFLQQLALGGECWDGEKIACIPPSPGNTWSDPFSDLELAKLHLAAQIDNIVDISKEVDNVKHELGSINCQDSACEEDTQQLVEQVMSGVAAVSNGPAHVLFDEISPNAMATTHLEQVVFRKLGFSDGGADDEVLVEFFGQVVWDEMPAKIDAHNGLLQHFAQSGDYCVEENKVESVDHATSQGASHVIFLAIPCMDVVWDDDLLGGHEYLEQAESKTANLSKLANLNKQKLVGLRRSNKLQVYLDDGEVLIELQNKVVWDSKMQSDVDKYEGLLPQLALGVDVKKAICTVKLNFHVVPTPISNPPHLRKQFQDVKHFHGKKRITAVDPYVDSITFYANVLSQYLEFGVVAARHVFNNMMGHGITEINQVSKVMLAERYDSFHPTESEKGLELFWMSDISPRQRARRQRGHLYHIYYGACSTHKMEYDCIHLVTFDKEKVICGAQYVIDERPPWRRSAFSPENDDTTTAHSVFHQIPSWNPNYFCPRSSAWISIVDLQKFQHGDHSINRTIDVSNYDIERMLCSVCLNVPWDPGGNHACFIPAIAWGQAMFCGGGNVIPGAMRYMGWNVIGFGPCGGLAVPSSKHKRKRWKMGKEQEKYSEEKNRGLEAKLPSQFGDPSPPIIL